MTPPIDIPALRKQIQIVRDVRHPDVVAKAPIISPPLTVAELEALLNVYEVALAWHRCSEHDGPCSRHERHLRAVIDRVRDSIAPHTRQKCAIGRTRGPIK